MTAKPDTLEDLALDASRLLMRLTRNYSLPEPDADECQRLAVALRHAALHPLPRTSHHPLANAPEAFCPLDTAPEPLDSIKV